MTADFAGPAGVGMPMSRKFTNTLVDLAMCAMLATTTTTALAEDQPAERTALRVCQDPNNLPFSNVAGEGIENRIAVLFGKALGLPVTYYSFPQRLAFIRNTLKFKLRAKTTLATS